MESRRGLGLLGSVIIATSLFALAAASGIIPFRQVIAQQRSVELAVQQRDALIAENLRLEQQIAALETPGEVERLAREQFGLVMPGVTAYVAVPIEDQDPLSGPPIVQFEERTPWWQKFWNFVTGRDLVPDG